MSEVVESADAVYRPALQAAREALAAVEQKKRALDVDAELERMRLVQLARAIVALSNQLGIDAPEDARAVLSVKGVQKRKRV